MSLEALSLKIKPLAQFLKSISLDDAGHARNLLEKRYPMADSTIQEIHGLMAEGVEEGWLLPKEQGGIRFGRVAKNLEGFSVDAVLMSSPGPRHRHGNGEIDLCFTTSGDAKFDGQPEGWVIYPPNSTHTPTVSGGEMLILYFLPGGAIEFL